MSVFNTQYTINEYLEQNGAIPCGQLENVREEVIRNSLCPGTYIVVLQCHKTCLRCPIAFWHFVNSISQSKYAFRYMYVSKVADDSWMTFLKTATVHLSLCWSRDCPIFDLIRFDQCKNGILKLWLLIALISAFIQMGGKILVSRFSVMYVVTVSPLDLDKGQHNCYNS